MKRCLILLNTLLMGLVLAVCGSSFAFDFPITYTGKYHLKQEFTNQYGTGICEGDGALTIILSADGNLTYKADVLLISTHDSTGQPRSCEIIPKGYSETLSGTYKDDGSFSVPSGSSIVPPITGNYDEKHITARRLWSWTGGQQTMDFDLPSSNQPPKITLEPATYPDFQMNILEGKGFTVKIRKEDGVKDSKGNWKLNWSTLIFATDGVDNSMNFVKKIADIVFWIINDDGKEVIFHITPNQKYFMLDHNVFNIQSNGVHKIGFQICDTDGRCGKSEYNIYFGPFFSAKSVRDMRCTDISYSLELRGATFGNIGHPSPRNTLYIALQNAVYPDNIWFCYDSSGHQIWEEGSPLPVWDNMIALATGDLWTTEYWFLNLTNSFHYNENKKQEFPAGDYIFYAVPIDNDGGALGGFFSQAVKTCLSGIDDI